jgi:hypothetical protein
VGLVCAVFALAAVVSASGYDLGWRSEAPTPPDALGALDGEILGTRGLDLLEGTRASEMLFAFGGADRVYGGSGNDLIDPGNGEDMVDAGPDDDRIRAFDASRDVIRCGAGVDVAYADSIDVTLDCEELVEATDPSSPATPDRPSPFDSDRRSVARSELLRPDRARRGRHLVRRRDQGAERALGGT